MEMIINTKTKEVVSADDFQMFSDWRKIKFINLIVKKFQLIKVLKFLVNMKMAKNSKVKN